MDRQIDENLRRVYAEAVEQEVPDRFTKLLAQLRQQGGDGCASDDPGDLDGKKK